MLVYAFQYAFFLLQARDFGAFGQNYSSIYQQQHIHTRKTTNKNNTHRSTTAFQSDFSDCSREFNLIKFCIDIYQLMTLYGCLCCCQRHTDHGNCRNKDISTTAKNK